MSLAEPGFAAATAESLRARLDDARKMAQRNDFAAALAALPPLVADISSSGDRLLLTEALIDLGRAQFRGAEYPKALASYQQSLELSRTIGNRSFEARSLWGMAQVRKNQGNYPTALELNNEARALYVALEDRGGEMRAWLLEGALFDLTGEYRSALQSYARARALMTDADANYGLVHSEMAITHKNLGEFERAKALYQIALDTHKRTGFQYGQANSLLGMGVLSATLGDYAQAIALLEESLAIIRSIGERRGEVYALGQLGDLWWQLDDGVRASAAYQQQLTLAQTLGISEPQVTALDGLGTIAIARGEDVAARDLYRRALEVERASSGGKEAHLLAALSGIELRTSKPELARELATRALNLAREAEEPETQWQARLALARAERAMGDVDDALRQLRAGVETINSVRGRVLTDSGKVGYLDARQDLFNELVGTLVEQSRPMEALEAAEAARGRAFSDLLASRATHGTTSDRTLLTDIRATEARLRAQSGMDATSPETRVELTQTRAATEARLNEQFRSLRDESRELASLVVAEPVSATEIQAIARRLGATIVEYLVTRDRLFIWVVTASGDVSASTTVIDRARLREAVRELHRAFNGLDAAALRDPSGAREALRQLHRWLVEPIGARLPKKTEDLVLVVPHDVLLTVPFAALEDSKGHALIANHTVAFAPSIATLRYTAEKKRLASQGTDARLLALADPLSPPDAALASLPGARSEVRQISQRFAKDRRLTLEGAAASEANAKQLGAGQTILHFAVHGLIRDDRPWDSALILSPGGGEDGWLRVDELFDLKLQADLVVLSGCSTGAGRLSGDGILGLGRAFIYAGTPSIIVSQWDVSDLSTAFLMERFYAELLAGRSKARALRAAQLAAQKRFAHPALWAAFALIGEPT